MMCTFFISIAYIFIATLELVCTSTIKDSVEENDNYRPIKNGDTFTPAELLPVVTKLISKVENPGEGKGIISSAHSPEDLADTLFDRFFNTPRRIVELQAHDIAGLDALQALALSGEVANFTSDITSTTSTLKKKKSEVKSKYMLLKKKMKRNVKRRGREDMLKKLGEKRRIVINPNRRNVKKADNKYNSGASKGKHGVSKSKIAKRSRKSKIKDAAKRDGTVNKNEYRELFGATPLPHLALEKYNENYSKMKSGKYICRWRYACSNPADLDTCELRTLCVKSSARKGNQHFIPVKHQEDEHTKQIKKARKMLGISIVDEEVEKILKARFIKLKLATLIEEPRLDKLQLNGELEGLKDYFHRLKLKKDQDNTTPMPSINNLIKKKKEDERHPKFDANDSAATVEQVDEQVPKNTKEEDEDRNERKDSRRILGIPTIPTMSSSLTKKRTF